MITISNANLRGRRLEPMEWRVRASFSPFARSAWTDNGRWWAVVICDEGLALCEWPRAKYWREMLKIGLRAGIAHAPTSVAGDAWPLVDGAGTEVKRAQLFPREELSGIVVNRSRWLWSKVHLLDNAGHRWSFTLIDPRIIERFANALASRFDITRSGYWPSAG
jgi:hypothetical protein